MNDDATYLRSIVSYEPTTGVFTRIVKTSNRIQVGDVAGLNIESTGYRKFTFRGRQHQAHRLAWLYVHGEWPTLHLDHINGDKADNRIANLREATMSQNLANTRLRSDNQSGRKGVFFHKRDKKWIARICVRGRKRVLGYFDDPDMAHDAYVNAAKTFFGEFARTA